MDKGGLQDKVLTVAIIGASGFVGQNLLKYLLKNTDYKIRAICRHPEQITFDAEYGERVEPVAVDIFESEKLEAALQGADAAVYLVHMMAAGGNYYELEAKAADIFGHAASKAGVPRTVYMGGLGSDTDKLSRHLRSRHNTGEILRRELPLVIEFRASMIVGDGSIAYDIMKNLVHRLPLQTVPGWAITQTQPIALEDALRYLMSALTVDLSRSEIIEIGGPEHLSYKDLIARYAAFTGKKPILILVPIVPLWLSAWWLNLFTPVRHAKVGRQMAESLRNPMIVTNQRAAEIFPDIHPVKIEQSFTQ